MTYCGVLPIAATKSCMQTPELNVSHVSGMTNMVMILIPVAEHFVDARLIATPSARFSRCILHLGDVVPDA